LDVSSNLVEKVFITGLKLYDKAFVLQSFNIERYDLVKSFCIFIA